MVKAPILKSGDKGIVKISCDNLLCLEKLEKLPYLARFALRDDNLTIAYGHIMKYKPVKKWKKYWFI